MTKKLPNNPFLISGYVSKDYFCDRENDTKNLRSALYNERNVVLISPRRIGKTGLINHLFAEVPTSEAYCIYVDLYRTTNICDFVEALGKAIMGNCGSASASERLMKAIQSLRFSFSADAITGLPEIGVNMVGSEPELSLSQIFAYMENSNKPVYVALDEFQQIKNYPEKNVEETLRSYIQHLRNVHFIFSGSQKHIIVDMFSSAKRAFYQSAQTMHIGVIPEDSYFEFCSRHFDKHKQKLSQDAFHFMYESLFAHTWYIQSIANRLYEWGTTEITIEEVQRAIRTLVEENSFSYQNYCRLFTANQLNVLKAIAKERIATEPSGQKFIAKYNLGAGSSVRSAVKNLVENEFVYEDDGKYSVYDRFFGIWLAM